MRNAVRTLPDFRRLVTTPNATVRAWWTAGAWEQLVPVLRAWAHRYAPRYVGITADDIEDLASKVIVRAWQSAYVPEHPSAWVRRVTINAARDLGKRALHVARQCPEVLRTLPARETADAWIDTDDSARRQRRVRRAVSALPRESRDVVRLLYFEGVGHREASARLGITEGCSKMRMVRAKPQLSRALRALARCA